MIAEVASLKHLFKEKVRIQHSFYRLFSVWTPVIVGTLYIMSAAREQMGKPIICSGSGKSGDVSNEYWENICWNFGTYTLTKKGFLELSSGVSQELKDSMRHVQNYHKHIWAAFFVLILMARLPFWIWRWLEKSLMASLCEDLKVRWTDDTVRKTQILRIIRFLTYEKNGKTFYMYSYFACSSAQICMSILSIEVVNFILHNQFRLLGPSIFYSRDEFTPSVLDSMFPIQAKCEGHYFGPTGGLVNLDLICCLPVNATYRIIFPLLWFWLTTTSVAGVTFIILEYFFSSDPDLAAQGRVLSLWEVSDGDLKLFKKCRPATIFLLKQLERNLNVIVYQELLKEFTRDLETIDDLV